MKFLLDENVALDAAARLRQLGYDTKHVRTDFPGIPDRMVLEIAASEHRVLVTLDKGFGSLVFRELINPTAGIVLFRVPFFDASQYVEFIANTLMSRADWEGRFSTVKTNGIRQVRF